MMLVALALSSFLFCVAVTVYTATRAEVVKGQSLKDSLQEAWVNIAIGFSINYVANFAILPLAVTGLDPVNNFLIGWIYTAFSFVRQFVLRRHYNRKTRGQYHEKG